MTLNQDEAIARTCECGEFDEYADFFWEDLTPTERFDIGKGHVRTEDVKPMAAWTPGEIKEADYVPF
jgi:hypothetical protein